MCTVTYINTGNKILITSNRDENAIRPGAYQPKEEVINDCRVFYPKDPKAGGTWFAVNDYGAVAVLLNGAFEKHEKAGPYTHSRGLVVLHAIAGPDPFNNILNFNLAGVEPFTLVLYKSNRLMELRWDGRMIHTCHLNPTNPFIWSSATLYTPEISARRESLFSNFLSQSPYPHEDEVVRFQGDNQNDPENGFIISRDNGIKTQSITQAVLQGGSCVLRHYDLRNAVTHQLPIAVKNHEAFHYGQVQA